MANRQLNDVERKLTAVNLARLKDEMQYIEIKKERIAFLLEKGMKLEIHNRILGLKKEQREVEAEEAEISMAIRVSEKQLREGVEPKEKK